MHPMNLGTEKITNLFIQYIGSRSIWDTCKCFITFSIIQAQFVVLASTSEQGVFSNTNTSHRGSESRKQIVVL